MLRAIHRDGVMAVAKNIEILAKYI